MATQQKVEPIAVDLDNLSAYAVGETMNLDTQPEMVDVAWEFGLPPQGGLFYDLRLALSSIGAFQDPVTKHFRLNLECRITSDDKESDDYPVFEMVSTTLGRGKTINTMAGLLIKAGIQVPSKLSPKDLLELCLASLRKDPIIRQNLIEWKGYSKEAKRNVFTSFESWPMPGKDIKTKKLVFKLPYRLKNDPTLYEEEITPRLYVVKWGWSDARKAKEAAAGIGKVGGGISVVAPVVATAVVHESNDAGFSEEDLAAAMET